jgi:hypothetical protein
MAATIFLSVVAFLVCGLVMGLGALFNRRSRCMRQGTCGRAPVEIGGVRLTCGACPNRDDKSEDDKPETPAGRAATSVDRAC